MRDLGHAAPVLERTAASRPLRARISLTVEGHLGRLPLRGREAARVTPHWHACGGRSMLARRRLLSLASVARLA
jgi:hypothetical protein